MLPHLRLLTEGGVSLIVQEPFSDSHECESTLVRTRSAHVLTDVDIISF